MIIIGMNYKDLTYTGRVGNRFSPMLTECVQGDLVVPHALIELG
jgi:hypothetical protein